MSVNWRILACRRHRRDLSLVATGSLTEADAPAALHHLARCPACQLKVAQFRALARLGSRSSTIDPTLFPTTTLRERWTREILDRRACPSPPACSARNDSDVPAPWAIGNLMRQPAGLLATAWLLIAFFWFGAPRITKPPASDDGLTWGQVIAALQPPSPSSPEAASPAAPPAPRTNELSPGPLGHNPREPWTTHWRNV